MSDPNLILKDTGSVEQTNRLVCMYAETVFQDKQTLRHIPVEPHQDRLRFLKLKRKHLLQIDMCHLCTQKCRSQKLTIKAVRE